MKINGYLSKTLAFVMALAIILATMPAISMQYAVAGETVSAPTVTFTVGEVEYGEDDTLYVGNDAKDIAITITTNGTTLTDISINNTALDMEDTDVYSKGDEKCSFTVSSDSVTKSNGKATLSVEVQYKTDDEAEAAETSASLTIEWDTTAPYVYFNNNSMSSWTETGSDMTGDIVESGSGIASVTASYTTDLNGTRTEISDADVDWYWDADYKCYKFTISWDSLPDGCYYLFATATDNVGNSGDAHVMIYKDTSKPGVTVEYDYDNKWTTSDNASIGYTVAEDVTYIASIDYTVKDENDEKVKSENLYKDDGGEGSAWSQKEKGTIDLSDLSDGTYTVVITATDRVGNTGESEEIKVKIDTGAPTVETAYSKDNVWTNDNSLSISITGKDETSGIGEISYTADGKTTKLYSYTDGDEVLNEKTANISLSELPDGDYTLTVTVTDIAGNETDASVNIKKDTDVPTGIISIQDKNDAWSELVSSITFSSMYNSKQTITVAANDSGSGVSSTKYYILKSNENETLIETYTTVSELQQNISDDEWTEYTGTFEIVANYTYVVYVCITDYAGNTTYLSSNGIVVDETAATIIMIYDSDAADPIMATVSDALAGLASVKISCTVDNKETVFYDQTYSAEAAVPGWSEVFTISADELFCGEYDVVVTAYDRAGNMSTGSVHYVEEHDYEITTTPATLSSDGIIATKCSKCGDENSAIIAKIEKVSLDASSYAYTGSAIEPAITVTDADGNVISSEYYTVTYADNIEIGTATVTVTFSGNYDGEYTTTFSIVEDDTDDNNDDSGDNTDNLDNTGGDNTDNTGGNDSDADDTDDTDTDNDGSAVVVITDDSGSDSDSDSASSSSSTSPQTGDVMPVFALELLLALALAAMFLSARKTKKAIERMR